MEDYLLTMPAERAHPTMARWRPTNAEPSAFVLLPKPVEMNAVAPLPARRTEQATARWAEPVIERAFPGTKAAAVVAVLTAVSHQWQRQHRRRAAHNNRVRNVVVRRAGSEVDMRMDIADRPEKKIVREINRYEDPDLPIRPPALPRPRRGLWAPPGPEAIDAPEVLVIGLGRQLRAGEEQGPRARLGAGALEALQRRYNIKTYYDADIRGYIGTGRASLDKTGRGGMQKIHFLQPLVEEHGDVGSSIYKAMQREKMDKATVLFVFSDPRLPFGQVRMRANYDALEPRLKSAFAAMGPDHIANTMHIGVGQLPANQDFGNLEIGALPRVLSNAATAIEVWLSEYDTGLVMRFINRPELYEMQASQEIEEGEVATPKAIEGANDDSQGEGVAVTTTTTMGTLIAPTEGDPFTLFDLNRQNAWEPPVVTLAPMSPESALATLAERPVSSEAIMIAGRKYGSLALLQKDLVELVLEHNPGMHLRIEDDENMLKTLLSYHPDSDRLLEDTVAVKVDVSPVDDNARCYWVVKFDGYEEDFSLKTCLNGLTQWLQADPPPNITNNMRTLGPGRWREGLRETTFGRANIMEKAARRANMKRML